VVIVIFATNQKGELIILSTKAYFEEMKCWIDVDFKLTRDELSFIIDNLGTNKTDKKFPKLIGKIADMYNFYDDYKGL